MFHSGVRVRCASMPLLIPCLLSLVFCLWGSPSPAQIESGTFVGTVTDSSGGVLSGATVTVTEVETNVSHKTSTNAQGEYNVAHLNPGL